MSSAQFALEVENLSVKYGLVAAVRNISFTIAPQRAVALLGNNGAGKTTILTALAGGLNGVAASSGTIRFGNQIFARQEVAARRRTGISIVPERDKVFPLLTVEENLRCAARDGDSGDIRRADILDLFPRLAERLDSLAGNMSGGEQQMLAISMALLGSPRILLLDEPMLGLAIPIIEQLCETLTNIRRKLGLSYLIAESEAVWLKAIADEALIIDRGTIVDNVTGDLSRQQDRLQMTMFGETQTSRYRRHDGCTDA